MPPDLKTQKVPKLPSPTDSHFEICGIERLASSLFPGAPLGRDFMILTAYFDESGTHDGSPCTVLAGFIGSTDDWISFEREWGKILKKYDVPYIRAKQLWHRQGPFRFSEERAGHLWADLLYVIQEHKNIIASKTILNNQDYAMFYWSDGPQPKERLDTPYALCFKSMLNFHPRFHRDRFTRGSMNFVMEAGHRNEGDALRIFNQIRSDKNIPWRDSLGSVSFMPKRQSAALQAADLLAYWSYQGAYESIRWHESGPSITEFEFELILSKITTLDHKIKPEDLMQMRKNFLRKRKKPVFVDTVLDIIGPIVNASSAYVGERPHEPIYEAQLPSLRRRAGARNISRN